MSDIRFNQWLHQSGTGGVSQVASGAVGVGTTNPLADFYVRGDAQITGILTAGHIAMGSSITFGDDDRAYFGDGTDLQIYHSGSHSFIQDTGTGNLFIDSNSVQIRNAAASKTTAKFIENAQVELYYNNTERIRTTNTGAVVTGILTATNRVHATSMRIANDNFTAAGNADELIIGDTSGNRGLTIVSGNTGIGALFFADDGQTNIGSLVYEHNTNQMRMVVNGAQVMRLDNTSVPTWIYGTDTNTYTSLPASDTIAFTTGGYERLRIDSSGKVGIGTNNPGFFTHIQADGVTGDVLKLTSTAGGQMMSIHNKAGSSYPAIVRFLSHNGSGFWDLQYNNTDDSFSFDKNDAEKVRILSNGNFGIGTNNPSQKLEVLGTTSLFGNGAASCQWGDTSYVGHLSYSSDGAIVRAASGKALIFHTNHVNERLRITSGGQVNIGTGELTQTARKLNVYGGATRVTQTSGGNTVEVFGHTTSGQSYGLLVNAGSTSGDYCANFRNSSGTTLFKIRGDGKIGINEATPSANLHVGGAYNETPAIITGGALGYNDVLQCNTANGHRRFTVAGDGTIYGPSGGRKNWFDNGSFDCIGGRRDNTSMDYGNYHAYGWVTDRWMSRDGTQWTRSANVPAGKGFSSSTSANAGGVMMQAVELADYGDMGVFAPSSYWCISFWGTVGANLGTCGFHYDLGGGYTGISQVASGSFLSSGETASGSSSGTFTRYYKNIQMPSSINSTAIAAYFTIGLLGSGYATGFQLERIPYSTAKPTPYEHVHPSVTTARCRRYAYQIVNSRLVMGYVRHDGSCNWQCKHPVPPTHMPSGSNQGNDPYGVILHDAGFITNFQSILQNPGVNNINRTEFDYRSGQFILYGTTSWGSTHTYIPSWESQELEIQHGFF